MNSLKLIGLALLVVIIVPTKVWAQEDEHRAVLSVASMLEQLDKDMQEWKLLSEQTGNADRMDREALLFRRDDRGFQLLADADALTAAVAELPSDDPARKGLENRLVADLRDTAEVVFGRLEELDQQIEDNTAALDALGAGARISTEAYVQALESARFQYYEALVNHYGSRKILGLPYTDLQERLKRVLFIHAEALAGLVEFSSTALNEVQARLGQDPKNADLAGAHANLSTRQSGWIDDLSSAADLLDKLEVDSSDYKTILVKYGSVVSLSLYEEDVFRNLLEEGLTALEDSVVQNAPDLVMRVLIFFLILLLFRFLARITRRVVRVSCDRSSLDLSSLLKDILVSATGGTVMVLGILMAFAQVGISLGPMLAGLGVAGFVVGFALQDTLGNFAAGAMILIYRPYDVDDFIEVTGASGLVKKMNLVSTTITTFDNQTLVIPNSKIWGDVIKNVTAQKVRRVDLEFGIGYGDDIEKTERVLADILESHDLVLKSPESMIKLHTLGDSSVNFVVRPWTKTEDYWDVYWDVTREVKMRFDREGISIPFPQRDVHVHEQAGQ